MFAVIFGRPGCPYCVRAKELAEKLNLSQTAVSMALNNKPGVSTETRRMVIETAEKYGEAQVKVWRRSFDIQPPALEPTDERNPALQAPYKNVDPKELPLTESLKDTIARVIPFYEENIKKDMLAGKQVLIAAHGNSLRALVKYLDNISENEITELNIPTGVPLVYEFDDNFNVTGHHYLGDQAAIEAKMNAVAKQGAKK